MNKPMEIPNSCYECRIVQSCKALPRWGDKATLTEYYHRRHADCPYTALLERVAELEGIRR